jgi:glycosyltransferase involved in cell wall biosynthesis
MARVMIAHNFREDSFSSMSHRLAHHLSERHEVVFMSYRPHLPDRLELNGKRLTVYPWTSRARPTGIRDALHLLRIFLRHRPEIVIAHFVGANMSILVSKLISGFRVRTYEWYHTQSYMIEFEHGPIPWFRRVRRQLYYRFFVDRVVAVSDLSALDYRSFYRLDNCSVLLNAIKDRYRRADLDPSATVLTVGFLSRLEGVKGMDVLLELIARLPADRFRFRIAGEGTYRRRLQSINQGNVEFMGFQPYGSVMTLMESCHVVIVPSHEDNLVTVGIETMMLARCLVISCRTGLSEYLEDGVNALVREPDAEAFGQALEELYADRGLMVRLSEEGRRTYLRRFSMEGHLRNVEQLVLG